MEWNWIGDYCVSADAEIYALEAMEERGGSFARHLSKAWSVADSENKGKLRSAFGALLLSYLPRGKFGVGPVLRAGEAPCWRERGYDVKYPDAPHYVSHEARRHS